jgi:hypothetical protein
MLLTCRRCSPRDDGGRPDELAAKYEDVLRARREATARLPLCRADYAGVAAGTDDDGNDDTPGLRRMRARLRRGHMHSHAGAGVQGRARLETLPRLGARARYRAGWPRRWLRRARAHPRRLAAPGVEQGRLAGPHRRSSRWLHATGHAGCVPRRRELAGSNRDAGAGKTEGGRACVREVEREKREMWAQKRRRGRENHFVQFGEEEQCSWLWLGAPTLACGAACVRENGLGRGLVAGPSWPGGLGRGGRELGRAGWAGEVARAGPTTPAAQGEGWARRWARRANGPHGCSRASWAMVGGALVAAGALGRALRGGPGGAAGPRGGKRGNGVGCALRCWAARPSWAERRRGCWAGFVFPFLFVFHLPYLFVFR